MQKNKEARDVIPEFLIQLSISKQDVKYQGKYISGLITFSGSFYVVVIIFVGHSYQAGAQQEH
jgi:hypothetical protein